MSRRLAVAVVLWCCAAVPARADTRGAVDWIFLVDTSGSMKKDRLDNDVQESLRTFIREAKDDDTTAIFAFARDVEAKTLTTPVRNREDLLAIIDSLTFNGQKTHLGLAIQEGVQRAKALPPDPTRTPAIVLFTDGKQDMKGVKGEVPVDANIQAALDSGASIFFVSMGVHDELLNRYKATVLHLTDRAEIRQVAAQIRKTIEPPAPALPPKPLKPPAPPPPSPEPPPPPSLAARIAKIATALALLVILTLVAKAKIRNAHLLEGEIEIVKPAVGADGAYIGLPSLRATEVTLSAIVPPDALAGSDARLFCRRKDGEKTMWIAATGGSLRVNDVETPMHELRDADTIRIGEASLLFHDLNRPRPQEDLS